MDLKNKVEALYGVELPATAAFDYPSVKGLAGYLISELDATASAAMGGEASEAGQLPNFIDPKP